MSRRALARASLLTAGIVAFVSFVVSSRDRSGPQGHEPNPITSPAKTPFPAAMEANGSSAPSEGDSVASLEPPRAGAEIVIALKDAGGQPIHGARVRLRSAAVDRESTSGADGFASFPCLEAGAFTFTVAGAGLPELVSAATVVVAPDERKVVPVRTGPYDQAIRGRVLSCTGAPIARVRVTAQRRLIEPGDADLLPAKPEALSDTSGPDGAFAISGLEAADYVLCTSPAGGFAPVRRVHRAGSGDADIVLGAVRLLRVFGSVTARGGGPVAAARVWTVGQEAQAVSTDASGSYDLQLEVEDDEAVHNIAATRPGYREGRTSFELAEAGTAESWRVDVVLDPANESTTVAGVVTDAAADPVAGEPVHLISASLNARHEALSGSDGRFALEGVLPAQDYKLAVRPRARFRDHARFPLEVTAGGLELDVVLEPLGASWLQGVLVDPGGSPVPRFTLRCRSGKQTSADAVLVTSDDAGRFQADVQEGPLTFETPALPSGAVELTVRGLQVGAGEVKAVRIVIDRGPHTLGGAVLDEAGSPVAGAAVSLLREVRDGELRSTSFRSTVTDADGRFAFSDLASGKHRITVTSPDHAPAHAEHEVEGDAAKAVIRVRRI